MRSAVTLTMRGNLVSYSKGQLALDTSLTLAPGTPVTNKLTYKIR